MNYNNQLPLPSYDPFAATSSVRAPSIMPFDQYYDILDDDLFTGNSSWTPFDVSLGSNPAAQAYSQNNIQLPPAAAAMSATAEVPFAINPTSTVQTTPNDVLANIMGHESINMPTSTFQPPFIFPVPSAFHRGATIAPKSTAQHSTRFPATSTFQLTPTFQPKPIFQSSPGFPTPISLKPAATTGSTSELATESTFIIEDTSSPETAFTPEPTSAIQSGFQAEPVSTVDPRMLEKPAPENMADTESFTFLDTRLTEDASNDSSDIFTQCLRKSAVALGPFEPLDVSGYFAAQELIDGVEKLVKASMTSLTEAQAGQIMAKWASAYEGGMAGASSSRDSTTLTPCEQYSSTNNNPSLADAVALLDSAVIKNTSPAFSDKGADRRHCFAEIAVIQSHSTVL
nr:hypothetical protein CFP56_60292 [Quercus suber]